MDPENFGKETIIKVTDWLRGIWEMRRRTGPVQQWVDSIPSPTKTKVTVPLLDQGNSFDTLKAVSAMTEPKDIPQNMSKIYGNPINITFSAPVNVSSLPMIGTNKLPSSLPHHTRLTRDLSLQSDSSHCSSVESLLELRKADPEAVLIGLGFGGGSSSPQDNGPLSRIPKRFLQPSRLKGIAIDDFVKQQQESSESFDSVSLGYRGLTGSPYVAPSEIVQKIMERLREHESHESDSPSTPNHFNHDGTVQQNGKLSVLSPDNRLFLEQPRSKSPDMRNKRMIIGHRSFAFGCDGDLIEIGPATVKKEASTNLENGNISNEENSFEDQLPEEVTVTERENFMSRCLQHQNISRDSNTFVEYPFHACTISDDDKILKDSITYKDERRCSDGFIGVNRNYTTDLLPYRRKSLKRQSCVTDSDEACYSDADRFTNKTSKDIECKLQTEDDANDVNIKESGITTLSDSTQNIVNSLTEDVSVAQSSDLVNSSKPNVNIEQINKAGQHENVSLTFSDDENESCCCNTSQTCKQDENLDCCCHANSTKCWKKMEKILEENRKLEHMVVKSRREVAEIRNMLSNVLSVRMEPGF